MRILSDNPIRIADDDLWGLCSAADDLCATLLAVESLPLTIDVFGSWGSGKTSLLELLRCRALESDQLKPVWFNAWKYERREEVWPALVQSILLELAKDASSTSVARRLASAARATVRVFAGRAVQLVSQGVVSAAEVDKVLQRLAGRATGAARLRQWV